MKCCGIWPLTAVIAEALGGRSGGGGGGGGGGGSGGGGGGGTVVIIDEPMVPMESDGGIESRPSLHDFRSTDVDARSRSSLLLPYPVLLLLLLFPSTDSVSAIDQIFVFLGVDTADTDDRGWLDDFNGGVTDFECTSPDASERKRLSGNRKTQSM